MDEGLGYCEFKELARSIRAIDEFKGTRRFLLHRVFLVVKVQENGCGDSASKSTGVGMADAADRCAKCLGDYSTSDTPLKQSFARTLSPSSVVIPVNDSATKQGSIPLVSALVLVQTECVLLSGCP